MEEARRTLAGVLVAGSLFWIAAEIVKAANGLQDDAGHALAIAGYGLTAVGIWSAVPARRNLLALIGAGAAFIGLAWLSYVALRQLGSAADIQANLTGSTLYLLAGILAAAGGAVVGVTLVMAGGVNLWLGAALIVAVVVAAIGWVANLTLSLQHLANIPAAAVLLLMGLRWMLPARVRMRWFSRLAPG